MTTRPAIALPDLIQSARPSLPAGRAWLVGGAVRDLILNRRSRDFDFAIDGPAVAVARAVADRLKGDVFTLDAERGVARVLVATPDGRVTLDFARLRGAGLAADLAARDFTLNAMALDPSAPDELIDPLGGLDDLRHKRLRLCAADAIAADPVRAVRAVRLAAQLNLQIDREARAAIRAQAGRLAEVSPERRRDELIRCLGGARPEAAVRALDLLGLLPALLPEMLALKGLPLKPPHLLDAWEHSLAVLQRLGDILSVLAPVHDVDAASDLTLGLVSVSLGRHRLRLADHLGLEFGGERPARWLLALAALLHDVGKPISSGLDELGRPAYRGHAGRGAELAGERLTELRFSVDEVRRVQTIISHHAWPHRLTKSEGSPSRREIYHFFRATGPAGVEVCLLGLADFLGKYGLTPPPETAWARQVEVCARLLTGYFEQRAEVLDPPALLNGHDLMAAFQLPPGPRLGELLEAVREAQAAGEISDRAGALEFARRLQA